jgi:hypothetical protein
LLENDLNVIDNEEGTCSCGKILDYSWVILMYISFDLLISYTYCLSFSHQR